MQVFLTPNHIKKIIEGVVKKILPFLDKKIAELLDERVSLVFRTEFYEHKTRVFELRKRYDELELTIHQFVDKSSKDYAALCERLSELRGEMMTLTSDLGHLEAKLLPIINEEPAEIAQMAKQEMMSEDENKTDKIPALQSPAGKTLPGIISDVPAKLRNDEQC